MTTTAEQLDAARALLDRWRAGDTVAREIMLARIHPVLYRWATAYTDDGDDAEDVAQQALIAADRKIGQYRGDAPLGVWLYRIVTSTAGQRRRLFARRKRLGALPQAQSERLVYTTDPGGRVDRQQLLQLVLRAYQALPPRQRAVLQLVDLEGNTPLEAAAMLNIAPSALRANLFKARAAVRSRLAAEHPHIAEHFGLMRKS